MNSLYHCAHSAVPLLSILIYYFRPVRGLFGPIEYANVCMLSKYLIKKFPEQNIVSASAESTTGIAEASMHVRILVNKIRPAGVWTSIVKIGSLSAL